MVFLSLLSLILCRLVCYTHTFHGVEAFYNGVYNVSGRRQFVCLS